MSKSTIPQQAANLREIAEAHHEAEKRLPKHDWADWYAAYADMRARGQDAIMATGFADTYVRGLLQQVAN